MLPFLVLEKPKLTSVRNLSIHTKRGVEKWPFPVAIVSVINKHNAID